MFPLAAGLSLCVGAFWWSLTLRHENAASVALSDNGRDWFIGGDQETNLPENFSPELRAAVTQAARSGRLMIPPDLAAPRQGGETFASRRSARPDTFRLLGPNATAVPDGAPRFRWTRVQDASNYWLRIVNKERRESVTEASISATTNEWSPAELLEPGASYTWSMQVRRGDFLIAQAPPERDAPACFRVLNRDERAAWERERATVGDSNFLRGIVAARAGLLEEAAEEFRALGRQNPRAEPARLFLEQVEPVGAR